jgi:hypothetical protein
VRALSKSEIVSIIQEGKRLSEQEGTAILDEFEKINHICIKQSLGRYRMV